MAFINSMTPRPIIGAGLPTPGEDRRAREGQATALGIAPDEAERRRQQTGVDPGAQGYVSGQVAPGSQVATAPAPVQAPAIPGGAAGAALAAPPGTTTAPPPAGASARSPAFRPFGSPQPAPRPSGTTTTQSALTSGAPPPGDDVTTVRSALTNTSGQAKSTVQAPNTGITQGASPVPTGGDASPSVAVLNEISPGLGDRFDIGGNLLKTNLADLSPTQQAQAAAMGLGENFNQERFDYRPGAAAAQDVVALEKAKADQMRAAQETALGGLRAAATGAVPSAAELQMRQEAGRNVAATLGQARALGGRSAGGAARAGTLATADILANTNVQGAQLRAAEQDRARQAEVAALSGVRGQDIDTAARDAQLKQDAFQNNLRSQLEQNELAEKHRQALIDAQLRALGLGTQAAGYTVGASAANAKAQNAFTGGLMDMAGGAFGLG